MGLAFLDLEGIAGLVDLGDIHTVGMAQEGEENLGQAADTKERLPHTACQDSQDQEGPHDPSQ